MCCIRYSCSECTLLESALHAQMEFWRLQAMKAKCGVISACQQSLKKLGMSIQRALTLESFNHCHGNGKNACKHKYQFIPLYLFQSFICASLKNAQCEIDRSIKSSASWTMNPEMASELLTVKLISQSGNERYTFNNCSFKYYYQSQLLRASFQVMRFETKCV